MKDHRRAFFIVVVLVVVFLPTIFGELITADDTNMVENLNANKHLGFYDLFFGPRANMFYYRPVLMSTFLLDKLLWSFNPFIMRFENVLIHTFAVLSLYAILKSIVRFDSHKDSWLPLLGALVFGINPIVTESVNWASGRSDLLAASFLFLSTLAIVKYKEEGGTVKLVLALLAWVFALLCKETAFAFAPGAILLLSVANRRAGVNDSPSCFCLRPFALLSITLFSAAVFVYLRSFAVLTSSSNVGITLKFILNDPWYSCFVAFRLLGFYLKKVFMPWPQNFAILAVDPVYELLGIVLFAVCVLTFFSRKYAAAFFLTGVLCLAPSFPIAFNSIAWTPYAERYAYIASGFITVAAILFIKDRLAELQWRYAILLLIVVVIFFGTSTWNRNKVWQTNEALWADTLEKSPDFHIALNEYGLVLLRAGDLDNAVSYLKKASSHRSQAFKYNLNFDIDLGSAYEKTGDFFAAEKTYRHILRRTKNNSTLAWRKLSNLYATELKSKNPSLDRRVLQELLQESRKSLYAIKHGISENEENGNLL